jgi:hypothetical protein
LVFHALEDERTIYYSTTSKDDRNHKIPKDNYSSLRHSVEGW